jgi:hypothetical protein
VFSGSLGMAALAFGFGAVHPGLVRLRASEDRGERLIGLEALICFLGTRIE